RVEWHRLPGALAAVNLQTIRDGMRRRNLHETHSSRGAAAYATSADLPPYRGYDGSGNDPHDPEMGRAGKPFDRNAPLHLTYPDRESVAAGPSPREVSRQLLAREAFRPAPTLNLLAAAWIQFQCQGWFSHGDNPAEEPFEITLAADDDWPERPMCV